MLTNYLKIAARTLLRFKLFSFINIIGLSLGLATCLLLFLFIQDQQDYDQFHQNPDQIYRIIGNYTSMSTSGAGFATTPPGLLPVLISEYPGVQSGVRLRRMSGKLVHDDDHKLVRIDGLYAGSSFFEIFNFRLAKGDPSTALKKPKSIVISNRVARKLFGSSNPAGQTITVPGMGKYTVRGVLDQRKHQSHLRFDAILSLNSLAQQRLSPSAKNWENITQTYTYIRLGEGVASSHIEEHLREIANRFYTKVRPSRTSFWLQPITNIALGPIIANEIGKGLIPGFVLYFLGGLTFLILLAAAFNYANLSIARSLQRSKEVGIRKIVGSGRMQIIIRFLSESVLISIGALLVAVLILVPLITSFNQLAIIQELGAQISIGILLKMPSTYVVLIGVALLTGVAAGLYPALSMAKYSPVNVLQGRAGLQNIRLAPRKILTILQFALSIIFIITAVLLYNQFALMTHSELGMATDNMLAVALPDTIGPSFQAEVERLTVIDKMSATSVLPFSGGSIQKNVKTNAGAVPVEADYYAVGPDFFELVEVQFTAGSFRPSGRFASGSVIVINQTAAHQLKMPSNESPNYAIDLEGIGEVQVVGIVQDLRLKGFREHIPPQLFHYNPNDFKYALLKIGSGEIAHAVNQIESVYTRLYPAVSFEVLSVSDLRERRSILFKDLAGIIGMIAVLAIIISCLGLLGIATYTVERRTKEIGIRKVLGANLKDLIPLLSKDFIILIVIATILGLPMAWMVNSLWLQQFALRVQPNTFIYIICSALVIFPALLIILIQTTRLAISDPVESLKT